MSSTSERGRAGYLEEESKWVARIRKNRHEKRGKTENSRGVGEREFLRRRDMREKG